MLNASMIAWRTSAVILFAPPFFRPDLGRFPPPGVLENPLFFKDRFPRLRCRRRQPAGVRQTGCSLLALPFRRPLVFRQVRALKAAVLPRGEMTRGRVSSAHVRL